MSLTLGGISEYDVEGSDLFNHQNTRTEEDIKNSTTCYNCMAYAFGAYEWLLPLDTWSEGAEDVDDILEELGIEYTEDLWDRIRDALVAHIYGDNILMELAIKRKLVMSPSRLRRIKSFDELKDDEYGIVYAAGGDGFHFGRYEDGVWTHKRAKSRIEEVGCEDDVFGKEYNSKRFYFAMKKGEVRDECEGKDFQDYGAV